MGFVTQVTRESRYWKGGEWGCNTSYKEKQVQERWGMGFVTQRYKGKQVQERWKTGFVTQVTRESRYRKGGEWSF